MSNEDLYKQAEARIDARIRFYTHAAVFAAVNLLLWFINYTNTPGHWWAKWPTFGWGIGLICHGVALFARQHGSPSAVRKVFVNE